jgi:hypothetical protein
MLSSVLRLSGAGFRLMHDPVPSFLQHPRLIPHVLWNASALLQIEQPVTHALALADQLCPNLAATDLLRWKNRFGHVLLFTFWGGPRALAKLPMPNLSNGSNTKHLGIWPAKLRQACQSSAADRELDCSPISQTAPVRSDSLNCPRRFQSLNPVRRTRELHARPPIVHVQQSRVVALKLHRLNQRQHDLVRAFRALFKGFLPHLSP